MENSYNPHWIGDEHCRDYRIGNIILKSVPDRIVQSYTKFNGTGYCGCTLTKGEVDEFVDKTQIEIKFDESMSVLKTG